MRITQSSITMASSRSYQAETKQVTTHLDRGQGAFAGTTRITSSTVLTRQREVEGSAAQYISSGDTLSSAEQAPYQFQTSTQAGSHPGFSLPASAASSDWLSGIRSEIDNDPKIQMLRKMMELLERVTGKKYMKGLLERPVGSGQSAYASASASFRHSSAFLGYMELNAAGTPGGMPADSSANGYWTRQTIESGFVAGEEHTAYSSIGTVVTADGRAINFGISLEMSRSFEAAYQVVGKEEVFTDPLVINLDTDAASLSDVSFYFDLDADGKGEEISTLGEGSGFLALDKNGDGQINDGSELFGARTGDGFGELAQYDQDGNGWIDEADEVFSRLSVWTKCGSGEAKLLSLKEAGVGAIFLGSQSTQFTLADASGSEDAVVRRTGLYLKENGQAGTIQHVDFKV